MFWYGWVGYKEMVDIPEDAMTIEVTAQMWLWQFKYETGKVTDSLYVPVESGKIDINIQTMLIILFLFRHSE